jgi:hypothetical protein
MKALAFIGLALLAGAALGQDPVTQALDATAAIGKANAQSQQRIDGLDDTTRAMLERYRAATWQAQQLTVYAQQLEQLTGSQDSEKASLQRQIAEMDRVERDLMPLLLRMIDSLEKFVGLDLPFLLTERKERLAGLKRVMADPETGVAEKFRRILEAYQVEIDYGRGFGAERADVDGEVMDVLRVGRVAMFALTLDGHSARHFEPADKTWKELPSRYIAAIKRGLRMARELATADLLVLPAPAPQQAEAATGATP